MSDFSFPYRLKRHQESVGSSSVEMEIIADLNETIDSLFSELEKTGNGSLLEELCPYFGTIWPSARALVRALADRGVHRGFQGERVLEVGCGLALPSLYLAKNGADVTATDFHPDVPRFLEKNLALNPPARIRYVRVDWQSPFPDLGSFDLVVGSDVLYERQHAISLARTVSKLVSERGEIWIADPARPYLQPFVDEMKALGFTHETEIVPVLDDSLQPPRPKEIFLIRLRRD